MIDFNDYGTRIQIDKYFKIQSPLPSTSGLLVSSRDHMEKLFDQESEVYMELIKKHNIEPNDSGAGRIAYKMEMEERRKNFKPSQEALAFLDSLNETYKSKKIKFYYSDPMLFHFDIDDPDCSHISVYEEICESIEMVGIVPMITTKDKNYPLLDLADLQIIENGSDSSSSNTISKDSLIKELRAFIETIDDEEKKEYCNDDLEGEDYIYIVRDNDDVSKELKRKVFQYQESILDNIFDYGLLAELYISNLNDSENAAKILKKAQEKIESFDDALSVANSIACEDCINNRDWAREVYKKAWSLAKNTDDFNSLGDMVSSDPFNDIAWGRKIYTAAYNKIENFDDALSVANSIADKSYINDRDWAREVYKKAWSLAKNTIDFNDLADMVSSDPFNDIAWGRKIYTAAYNINESMSDIILVAISVMDECYLSDKEWATELLKDYESKASTFSEFVSLIEIVIGRYFLNDQEWGIQIIEKLRPLCKSTDDYVKIIEQCETQNKLVAKLTKEAILLLENDKQKKSLAEAIDYWVKDNELANEIKNNSIEELKNQYGKPSTDDLVK